MGETRQAGASAWGRGLRWEVDRKTILTITQRIAARCLKVKANPKHRTRKFQANNHTHIHIHRAKQKKDVCIDMSRSTNKNMKKRVGSIALTVLVALVALASVVSMPSAEASITGRRLQLSVPFYGKKILKPPSLTFRNCYSGPRYVSFGWYDDGAWTTRGRWKIGGGDTETYSNLFKHLRSNKSLYFRVEESDRKGIRYNSDKFPIEKLCRSTGSPYKIVRERGAGKNEYKVNGKYRSCPVKHIFYQVGYRQRDSSNNKVFKMGCS